MGLTVGSLFSGIGGLDLGLERAGMTVIWQSEINPYSNLILKKHWPEVVNHGNIKDIDWDTVTAPDIICGGYPCQPFSTAGSRRGKDDPRHLWPWVLDSISRLRPKYAILENVRGHLSMGGMSVIGDLASIGYDSEWRIISASSLGASHRRDRVIIVAYPQSSGNLQHTGQCTQPDPSGCCDDDPTRDKYTTFHREISGSESSDAGRREVFSGDTRGIWSPSKWETQPSVGRMVDGFPHRMDRVRALGNAVVPQVAEAVGRLVLAHWEAQ